MRSSDDDEGPTDSKKKQFAQFKSANSFFLASDASEEERKLFLVREQKRKELTKLERQFEEDEKEYRRKYEGAKKQLQEKLEKEEMEKEDNDSDNDDDEVSEERFSIKQEKNFPSVMERNNKKFEGEMQKFDQEKEREIYEIKEQFIAQKKKIQVQLNIIEKKTKKKNRVIQTDVNPQLKQKMEAILTDADGVFENFDALYHLNPKNTIHFCSKLLTKPTEKEVQESDEVAALLRENIQKNGEDESGVEIIMLGLKEQYEKDGGTFNLCRKSSPKTQLCTKILTSGFFQNLILFTQHLKDNQQWDFDSLYCDLEGKKTAEFRKWYIRQKAKEYNIDEDSIVITKLVEGSIKVEWTVVGTAAAAGIVINKNKETKKLKLHRFFQHFSLSPEDFDIRGNMQYDDFVYEDVRGGWPYYLPVHCKRYGLKVSGRYDKKNDDWLMMDENKNQWAVAFHGVADPENFYNDIQVFNSIMSGINEGRMLLPGRNNAYEYDIAVNQPAQKVGVGIYCSPHFQECLDYTNVLKVGKEYNLVLQCRVRPSKIKVCDGCEEYWVINEPIDIRPYGILLVKQEERRKNIKGAKQLFGKKFKYNRQKMNPEESTAANSFL